MASKFFAVVAGVGSGTGHAVALRFAKSYPVILLSRRPESYVDTVKEIEASGGRAIGIPTDVTDQASVQSAFATARKELPGLKLAAAVYNANSGFVYKPFLEQTIENLDNGLKGAAHGFFLFAQSSLPLLLEAASDSPNPPTLVATGATASIRGSVNFATFAAGKFALRALAQSLAREFGPKGVHVAHAIIDGGIDVPWAPKSDVAEADKDKKLKPEAIAESYWHLHAQHRSAFTQELDLRPYAEKF